MIILYWCIGVLLWIILGFIILSLLDAPDYKYFLWLERDPTGGIYTFIILILWPIMAYTMIVDTYL